MKYILNFLLSSLLVFCLVGCEPETDYLQEMDYGRISHVIADNFNLSHFSTALRRTQLHNTLQEPGPFTVLVPSNDAFDQDLSVPSTTTASLDWVTQMANYHVLDGLYELDKLPFLFNQEITTRTGRPVYVTRWIDANNGDTVLTVNGSKVSARNIVCTNGLVQILDKVLTPNVHDNLADAIASRTDLTLFSQAIQRSGDHAVLGDPGEYTVFAPDNAAMAAYGLPTFEAINTVDPSLLSALVRYHIIPKRNFYNDYIISIPMVTPTVLRVSLPISPGSSFLVTYNLQGFAGEQYGVMLDGSTVTFRAAYGSSVFSSIEASYFGLTDLTGESAEVDQSDIIAYNGVLHVVNKVLKNGAY